MDTKNTKDHEGHEEEYLLEHGESLSRRVIGSAIRVHRAVGPGLLESIYFNVARLKEGLRRIVI